MELKLRKWKRNGTGEKTFTTEISGNAFKCRRSTFSFSLRLCAKFTFRDRTNTGERDDEIRGNDVRTLKLMPNKGFDAKKTWERTM